MKKEHHAYYALAQLKRKTSQASIQEIVDLRRTGLAVLSQEVTIKDGKVGIGTPTPKLTLNVVPRQENDGVLIGTGENGAPSLSIGINKAQGGSWLQSSTSSSTGDWGHLAINPNGGNVGIGIISPQGTLYIKTRGQQALVIEGLPYSDLNSRDIYDMAETIANQTLVVGAVKDKMLFFYWKSNNILYALPLEGEMWTKTN